MNTSEKNLKNGREREKGQDVPAWIRIVDVGEDWRYPHIAERSEEIESDTSRYSKKVRNR